MGWGGQRLVNFQLFRGWMHMKVKYFNQREVWLNVVKPSSPLGFWEFLWHMWNELSIQSLWWEFRAEKVWWGGVSQWVISEASFKECDVFGERETSSKYTARAGMVQRQEGRLAKGPWPARHAPWGAVFSRAQRRGRSQKGYTSSASQGFALPKRERSSQNE